MAHSTFAPTSRLVSVGRAAELLGVSLNTVRKMCDCGELRHVTTIGNHRRIEIGAINRWLGFDEDETTERKTLIYARVSGRVQKQQGNLDRQAERLLIYCRDELDEHEENILSVSEQGSGLAETRPGYLRLLDLVISGHIKRIVVEHRDRLARYGVVVLETLCDKFGVEIIITNAKEEISEDEEMTADILSLVTVYAARRHGKRGADTLQMPLTEEVKARIIQLHQQGISQDRIAAKIQEEEFRCEKTGKLFKINAVRQALLEHEKLKRATSALAPNGPDTLQEFLSESCETSPANDARVFTRPLHAAYSEWCRQHQIDAPTSRMMTARLKNLGFQTQQNSKGYCYVKGLTLKGNPRAGKTHLS